MTVAGLKGRFSYSGRVVLRSDADCGVSLSMYRYGSNSISLLTRSVGTPRSLCEVKSVYDKHDGPPASTLKKLSCPIPAAPVKLCALHRTSFDCKSI